MALTLKLALELINAALDAGREHEIQIAAVVIDRGGRVLASARSEMTGYKSLEIAERKAVTSNTFGAPTLGIVEVAKSDPIFMSAASADPSLAIIPGGLPIMLDGQLVGALGVAGGHYLKDHAIAEQAMKLIG